MTYNDIQGWFTWREIYDQMANEVRPNGTMVELGVWKGKSLAYLGQKLLEIGKPNVRLLGVDSFCGAGWGGYGGIIRRDLEQGERRSVLQQCRENLNACGQDRVELIVSDCISAAHRFADGSVDFLFVDDNHTPEHVRPELDAWLPKLRRPTWIAGDDVQDVASEILRRFPAATITKCHWMANIP